MINKHRNFYIISNFDYNFRFDNMQRVFKEKVCSSSDYHSSSSFLSDFGYINHRYYMQTHKLTFKNVLTHINIYHYILSNCWQCLLTTLVNQISRWWWYPSNTDKLVHDWPTTYTYYCTFLNICRQFILSIPIDITKTGNH